MVWGSYCCCWESWQPFISVTTWRSCSATGDTLGVMKLKMVSLSAYIDIFTPQETWTFWWKHKNNIKRVSQRKQLTRKQQVNRHLFSQLIGQIVQWWDDMIIIIILKEIAKARSKKKIPISEFILNYISLLSSADYSHSLVPQTWTISIRVWYQTFIKYKY